MDNSSLALMHELSQKGYSSDKILGVYDLTESSKSPASIAKSNKQLFGYEQVAKRIANIRLTSDTKVVMEEIEDFAYRSAYIEQLQVQGYLIRWINETNYGTFVNDEDVNLYYIVEAAMSRVSELMRFLRRKVKTEDLIDLPSAEEWMNRLYDEWPVCGKTLPTGRVLKKNAGEISLTILAEINLRYQMTQSPPEVATYFGMH